MTTSSKRLSRQIIKNDTTAMTGLDTVPSYATDRREATPEAIRYAYETMVKLQNLETEQAETARATAIAARDAEITFHKSVVAMREVVRGKYGSDSLEARAVGLTRTSDRKPAKSKKK
ncbi:MAG: hypothetical protein MUC48_14985 [Leptolyngbya sp. Prado105]|nr:hypothetical protein [Leptolyngbya sp. Prado105]